MPIRGTIPSLSMINSSLSRINIKINMSKRISNTCLRFLSSSNNNMFRSAKGRFHRAGHCSSNSNVFPNNNKEFLNSSSNSNLGDSSNNALFLNNSAHPTSNNGKLSSSNSSRYRNNNSGLLSKGLPKVSSNLGAPSNHPSKTNTINQWMGLGQRMVLCAYGSEGGPQRKGSGWGERYCPKVFIELL